MTPDKYCGRWKLGPDYPMVTPSYGEQRSALAKSIGDTAILLTQGSGEPYAGFRSA